MTRSMLISNKVVLKDEAQYKDTKLRNYQVQNEILYRDNLL